MNITEWVKEIHENAVKHGWWETERSTGEVIALIHSELSEALEEARDSRPMMYVLGPNGEEICTPCYFNGRKPEGIAVELADAVIRVLDMAAYIHAPLERYAETRGELKNFVDAGDFGSQIAWLHGLVVDLHIGLLEKNAEKILTVMLAFIDEVDLYLQAQSLDLWQVIELKHNYNKGRPYKHGEAF